MIQLKIKVTKDVLIKSAGCTGLGKDHLGANCAIAVAVRDIFPFAHVGMCSIDVDYWERNPTGEVCCVDHIKLPQEATDFINEFDTCSKGARLWMQPIEFEIEIPDNIIEKINIDEVKPLLKNHPTLELIQN